MILLPGEVVVEALAADRNHDHDRAAENRLKGDRLPPKKGRKALLLALRQEAKKAVSSIHDQKRPQEEQVSRKLPKKLIPSRNLRPLSKGSKPAKPIDR